jgi:hypothetical protein
MRAILKLEKLFILFFLLLVSSFSFGQEKSILYNEINHHIENGDFRSDNIELFTGKKQVFNNKDKYLSLKIEIQKINSIIEKSDKFISFKIPFSETESKIVLLKKRELLDDEFKLAIQEFSGKNESANKPNYVAYSGLLKSNLEQSFVSVIFYNNEIHASVFINDKEFTIKKIDENENTYNIQEVIIDENQPSFACGVRDEDNVNLKEAAAERNQQTTIPKCVKLHFEITKTLNDQFGGISQSILQFFNHFNLVQTKFANEGITVRVSYLKIWNTDDPYYQSWIGSPGSPGAFQDLGFRSFQSLGGNINGNIGILLGTFIGGVSGVSGGAPCPNQGYNAVSIFENSLNQNSATIMHEIGHSFGSHHTHWCGWIGGALDNCAATEGGCPSGPDPTNGGTIMSYCGGYYQINNGFGTQPNGVINNTVTNESCITSCNSEITCEDNIVNVSSVSNSSATSFTINWTANYPIKVYYKELSATNFTLLSTVQLPNNSYTISYTPASNCTIQKFEIKLVAVCPNGDSKPTVIVYSPQAHLKPFVGILDNYTCNITNATINNLTATGENLKWFTTETGGTPILSTYIFPENTYTVLYVSQTVNGCESERTRVVVNFQNIPTPSGQSTQIFNCNTPTIADLEVTGTNVLWWTSPSGGLSPNIDTILQNNTTYYAESNSIQRNCVSQQRLPVLVQINSSGAIPYTLPFTEEFNSKLCNLGYTNEDGFNASGSQVNNTFRLASFGPNGRVFTKAINLVAGVPIIISFKVKNYNNPSNEDLITKIGSNLNFENQLLLGSIVPNSSTTYNNVVYNFIPTTTGLYYISFDFTSSAYFRGVYIDDLSVSTNNTSFASVSIVGQNIGTPWESDIALYTSDGLIYVLSNYNLPSGLFKFRQNNNWEINWGGTSANGTFPNGIGVQDGINIPGIVGTYNVTFNRSTGAYLFETTLNTNDIFPNSIKIYPNPANTIVNISATNETIELINVYDMFGRLLKSQKGSSDNEKINIQDFPNAMYFMEIKTDKGNKTVKIVKQ